VDGFVIFRFEDDFFVEFVKLGADLFENFTTLRSEAIILARAASPAMRRRFQPALPHETMKEGIECPWADFVTVTAQFGNNPLAVNGLPGGVVQNVHFPEAEEDFAVQAWHRLKR